MPEKKHFENVDRQTEPQTDMLTDNKSHYNGMLVNQ